MAAEKKSRGWLWALLGCAGLVIVGAVVLLVTGVIMFPSRSLDRRDAEESAAVAALRTCATAQAAYRREDWDSDGVKAYATPYALLHNQAGERGKPIELIDAGLAAARGERGEPHQGYLFQGMRTIAGKKINWVDDFALCAAPAEYGKAGRRTFIIKTDATTWAKDLGKSEFVKDFPADPAAEGWTRVE